MSDPANALVVWGSTGRRLQFSLQDLRMPEEVRDSPHAHFYEKHWETVAGFWFNRVLKEASLQQLEVAQIVELIQKDITKRWEKRREEQALHKKRKRLLQASGGPAGTPSSAILLTNVVALPTFAAFTAEERTPLVAAVVSRVAEVTKEDVAAWRVLVDDAATPTSTEDSPEAKKTRTESSSAPTTAASDTPTEAHVGASSLSPVVFDDRVAVICTLSCKEKAALAIARLHGSKFDGRGVVCRFWAAS